VAGGYDRQRAHQVLPLTLILLALFQHLMMFLAVRSFGKAIRSLLRAYRHLVPFCLFTIFNTLPYQSLEPNFGSKGEIFYLVATDLL
jgi:hypothetical protein